MNKLRQMSLFAHVVERGSISAAAEYLDLSKSVLSQHLKKLESELGVKLLNRTTRRQTLTRAGETFYQSCRTLNHLADEAWESVYKLKAEVKGRVKITAPHAFMDTLLTPVVIELQQRFPDLYIELIGEDRHLDLLEHDIDIAIRVGQSQDSDMKQRRIGTFRDVLCGHHSLLGRSLAELAYIANHWQGESVGHDFALPHNETRSMQFIPRYRASSFHTCLSLLQQGVGIGVIPDFCLPYTKGELVAMLPNWQLSENPIYVVHPFGSGIPKAASECMQAIEQHWQTYPQSQRCE